MDLEQLLRASLPIEEPRSGFAARVMARLAKPKVANSSTVILIGTLAAIAAAAAPLVLQLSKTPPRSQTASHHLSLHTPVTAVPDSMKAQRLATPPPPAEPRALGKPSLSEAEAPGSHRGASVQRAAQEVPALPGVEGYYLPAHLGGAQFSISLEAEVRDPVWAPDMEARIKEALRKREELLGLNATVLCRNTSCGLLFVFNPEDDYESLRARVKDFRDSVASELHFAGRGTASMNRGARGRYMQLSLTGAIERQHLLRVDSPATAPGIEGFTPPAYGGPANPAAPAMMPTTSMDALASEVVDRSVASLELEGELRRLAAAIGGNFLNQPQVECRVSTCRVSLSYTSGQAPPSDDLFLKHFRVAGYNAASLEFRGGVSGAYDGLLTIDVRRNPGR